MAKGAYIGVIPGQYEELEYLESTGYQLIETDYYPNHNTRILAKVKCIPNQYNDNYVFGAIGADGKKAFTFRSNSNLRYITEYSNYNNQFEQAASTDKEFILDKNKKTTTITTSTGTYTVTAEPSESNFTSSVPLILFGILNSNYVGGAQGSATIYYLKIYDNDVLVRDFIPCKDLTNGNIGVYDKISKKFFINTSNTPDRQFNIGASTGNIIDKPSVARKVKKIYVGVYEGHFNPVSLPSGYTYVEYLQASNLNYINTDFCPDSNTRIVAKFKCTNSDYVRYLFGARTTSDYEFNCFTNIADGINVGWGTYGSPIIATNNNEPFTIDINKNIATVRNNSFTFPQETFTNKHHELYIFTSGDDVVSCNGARLYYFKIYDNGTLVRNFVPCINNSNGVPGLFDLVNAKFYTDASGHVNNFVAGPSTDTYTPKARKIKKAYIGIGGVARPCFTGGELAYSGRTIQGFSNAKSNLAATSIGNYALFGGGRTSTYGNCGNVECYNKSLIRSVVPTITPRHSLAATSIGDYAIFAGGCVDDGSSTFDRVDLYNTSLIHSYATNISVARYGLKATSTVKYAFFGGGYYGSRKKTVDCYDQSLTHYIAPDLKYYTSSHAATSIGNYALFGGGSIVDQTVINSQTVDWYNLSLTHSILTNLSVARCDLAATSIGNYALFGGGYGDILYKTIDCYDTSLTHSVATNLSVARYNLEATPIGNYALFGGGASRASITSSVSYHNTVEGYVVL